TDHELHGGAVLAMEIREIRLEDAEEAGPAALGAGELIVPLIGAREQTVHHADDAGAAGAGFDDPFRRQRWRAGFPAFALAGESMRALFQHALRDGVHAWTKMTDDRPIVAHLGGHEPRRNALRRRDRVPHLLRRARHFDFD